MTYAIIYFITLLLTCTLCRSNEQHEKHQKHETLDNKTTNDSKHQETHVKNKMHDAKHIQDKE